MKRNDEVRIKKDLVGREGKRRGVSEGSCYIRVKMVGCCRATLE